MRIFALERLIREGFGLTCTKPLSSAFVCRPYRTCLQPSDTCIHCTYLPRISVKGSCQALCLNYPDGTSLCSLAIDRSHKNREPTSKPLSFDKSSFFESKRQTATLRKSGRLDATRWLFGVGKCWPEKRLLSPCLGHATIQRFILHSQSNLLVLEPWAIKR